MSVNVSFSLSDNRDLIRQAAKEQIITALEAVGIQSEGDIKDYTGNTDIAEIAGGFQIRKPPAIFRYGSDIRIRRKR